MNISYLEWLPKVLSVALDASKAIINVYNQDNYQTTLKLDNSPVTEADLLSHQIIEAGLQQLDPALPVLSEEGRDVSFEERTLWSRYWLVDPLDGTREFLGKSDEFTINIALIEDHQPVLGVVVAPALRQFYWAVRGDKAYFQTEGKDAHPIQTNQVRRSPLKIAISKRSHNKFANAWVALEKRLGVYDLTYCGSALKMCLVARGVVDLYPRFGATSEWDTAAGQCILEVAGGQVIDLSGKPLRYNTKASLENSGFYAIGESSLASLCCG